MNWRAVKGRAFLLSAALLFSNHPAWAQKPFFRFAQGARANLRKSTDVSSEAVTRLEANLFHRSWWELFPFLEGRRLIDADHWSRVELGGEWRAKPFLELLPPFSWFWVGHSLQQAWVFPGRDHVEWETRTGFDVPLSFLKVRSRAVGVYALNEYTYDLQMGAAVRNEVGAGFIIPLPAPRFSVLLGWKHVDRIHLTDADQFEGSLLAEF